MPQTSSLISFYASDLILLGDKFMDRIRVSSSNLKSVGYDVTDSILEVEFHNGGIYQYFNVPEHKYDGLMRASSKGSYFDTYIKKAGYRYRKIR
jgi:KTSC domain